MKPEYRWVQRAGKNAHLAEDGASQAICGAHVEFSDPLEFKPDEGFCCHLCAVRAITDGIAVAEVEEEDVDYE